MQESQHSKLSGSSRPAVRKMHQAIDISRVGSNPCGEFAHSAERPPGCLTSIRVPSFSAKRPFLPAFLPCLAEILTKRKRISRGQVEFRFENARLFRTQRPKSANPYGGSVIEDRRKSLVEK